MTARTPLLVLAPVLLCAGLAIVTHAVLPAQVDPDLLDGVLVRRLGFPIVALSYFILLYAHCAAVITINRTRLRRKKTSGGLLLGSAFALLYMVGMQEIMLDGTSFSSWDLNYVAYQLLIGLGDAVPAIILCVSVSALVGGKPRERAPVRPSVSTTVLLYTVLVGTTRLLGSSFGLIKSHVADYPVPVIAWGLALGCAFGIGDRLLKQAYVRSSAVVLYGLGLNWAIFNLFIALVKSGTIGDVLTRSLLDVTALATTMGLLECVARRRGLPAASSAAARVEQDRGPPPRC